MRYKLIKTLLLYFLLLCISACKPNPTIIDKDLPLNVNITSAKELAAVSELYIADYWGERDFHIGMISMKLNNSDEGIVTLRYAESLKDKPNVVELSINTSLNKIETISHIGKGSKIDPGIINLSKWKVDSNEAIQLAKQKISEKFSISDYESINIKSNNVYLGNREVWAIVMEGQERVFWARVNPYSGEVEFDEIK